MTLQASTDPAMTQPDNHSNPARASDRACLWRLAIGGAGLSFVGLVVWLVGSVIP
jgi:hypothetical protein